MEIKDANIAMQRFSTELTNVAVPGFFLISGFLFFTGILKLTDFPRKWKGRVKSLLMPYLLWNGLSMIFWLCVSAIPPLRPQMQISFEMDYSLLWFLSRMTYKPIVGQFWYIRTLMIFMLLAPLVWFFIRSWWTWWGVLMICFFLWVPIDTRIFSTEGFLFFITGGFIAYHGGLPKERPVKTWLWLCMLVLILIILGMVGYGNWKIVNAIKLGMLLYFLWQFSLWLTRKEVISKKVCFLSQHSFFLYALHGHIVKGISLLIARAISHTPSYSAMTFMGSFLVTLGLCIILSILSEKFFPKFHSVFSGGR